MGNLFQELKRRKVFRVAAVYAIVAWLLIQIAGEVLPTFGAPVWINQTIIFLFILGFFPTLIAAWAYEISPDGIRLDVGTSETQSIPIPDPLKQTSFARHKTFSVVAVSTVVVAFAVGAVLFIMANRDSGERRARQVILPEVLAFVEEGNFSAAFELGLEIEAIIPDDPALNNAMERSSIITTIATEPQGADVYIRPYGDSDVEWQLLGKGPIEEVRWPRSSAVQLKIEAEGYETRILASGVPGFYLARTPTPAVIELVPAGSVPEGMVYIPGGEFPVRVMGLSIDPIFLEAYFLDRNEVTNAKYFEFIRAGGYEREVYWDGLEFMLDGQRLSWAQAMSEMVDSTGRPGPATWEFGTYPTGQENFPVTGVSWYEAVAYTQFRGTSLPTLYHWARAASEPQIEFQNFPTAMLPLANFLGDSPRAVASSRAMGPNGTFDMAGNVKEWVLNSDGDSRWLMGGGWSDSDSVYSVRYTSPPFDRAAANGIRGAMYPQGSVREELLEPILSVWREISDVTPVSNDVYEAYFNEMRYISSELDVQQVSVDTSHPDWRHEVMSLPTDVSGERFEFHLFFPASKYAISPYQAVIHFPGIGGFRSLGTLNAVGVLTSNVFLLGDIVRSGRVLVLPQWAGSFERWDDFLSQPGEQGLRSKSAKLREWTAELGKIIDYLESRPEIDNSRIGYYGYSFGGSTALPLLALENRIRAALIYAGGYPNIPMPPNVDLAHYAPRITIPVLMIGGLYDAVFPIEISQRPLLERLGTPESQKELRIYNIRHSPPPRRQFLGDALPWLDEYLGLVRRPE